MTEEIQSQNQNEEEGSQTRIDQQQPSTNVSVSEEELKEQGRVALIQLETEGKRYFKPQEDVTYRLTFDRVQALNVRGIPSDRLTRDVKDRNDPGKIIGTKPVLEWVYEIQHITGNKQLWSVTSKKLATKILKQLIDGKSILDVTRIKTGPKKTDIEYTVVGIE
jgi:hypothetical protein